MGVESTAKMGAMLTQGSDGQITIASASLIASKIWGGGLRGI